MSLKTIKLVQPSAAYQENYGRIPIYVATDMSRLKNQTPNEMSMQARRIVQAQRLAISADRRMIGNEEGINLFQMLNGMSRRMDEQTRRIEEQNRRIEEQNRRMEEQTRINEDQNQRIESLDEERFLNRINELVGNGPRSSEHNDMREKRNSRIHGGNIEMDLKALDWTRRNNRYNDLFSAATEGFEAIYDVKFKKWESLIDVAPREVIEFANKKGDLTLRVCYRNKYGQEEIKSMKETCKEAIKLWEDSHHQGAAYPIDKIKAKRSQYDDLHLAWKNELEKGKKNKMGKS